MSLIKLTTNTMLNRAKRKAEIRLRMLEEKYGDDFLKANNYDYLDMSNNFESIGICENDINAIKFIINAWEIAPDRNVYLDTADIEVIQRYRF